MTGTIDSDYEAAVSDLATKLDAALGVLRPEDNHRVIMENSDGVGCLIDIRASDMEGRTYNLLFGVLDGQGDFASDASNSTGKMAQQMNVTSEQAADQLLTLAEQGYSIRRADGESDALVTLVEGFMPTACKPVIPGAYFPDVNTFPALVG